MNWTTFIQIIILGVILITVGYFMIKYINGDYSFKDEIYSETTRKVIKSNDFGNYREYHVNIIVIKRTYQNGEIRFIQKEVKI